MSFPSNNLVKKLIYIFSRLDFLKLHMLDVFELRSWTTFQKLALFIWWIFSNCIWQLQSTNVCETGKLATTNHRLLEKCQREKKDRETWKDIFLLALYPLRKVLSKDKHSDYFSAFLIVSTCRHFVLIKRVQKTAFPNVPSDLEVNMKNSILVTGLLLASLALAHSSQPQTSSYGNPFQSKFCSQHMLFEQLWMLRGNKNPCF